MNRHNWTSQEDTSLKSVVAQNGADDWSLNATTLRQICPSAAAKKRSGKQCRERWYNHLDPSVKKSKWTEEEQLQLFQVHKAYGNKWKEISQHLPGRTDNDIKNRFYSTLRRSLRRLNKYIGKKNSTSELRQIKPSVLTIIINFIYDHEAQDTEDTLFKSLRELPQLIFKFSTFKPVKQNMTSNHDEEMHKKISMIMQLVDQFKQSYGREKAEDENQRVNKDASRSKNHNCKKQDIPGGEDEQDESQLQIGSPLVKRQNSDDKQVIVTPHKYVAREITPIITIERKPSVKVESSQKGFSNLKCQNVFDLKMGVSDIKQHMMGLEDELNADLMPIEEPSMSSMQMQLHKDDILGSLVVVGKQIQPIEYEATQQNHDKHIDEVLYENYDARQ